MKRNARAAIADQGGNGAQVATPDNGSSNLAVAEQTSVDLRVILESMQRMQRAGHVSARAFMRHEARGARWNSR